MSTQANWMSDMAGSLHGLPLRSVLIPGSHDSGAHEYAAWPQSSDDSDTGLWLAGIAGGIAFKGWSRTQTRDFAQQLDDGIRYFDLRVACDGSAKMSNMYCVHSLWAAPVSKLLRAVKSFTQAHPGEVIILDINHTYSLSAQGAAVLARGIVEELGPHITPRAGLLDDAGRLRDTTTVGAVLATGRPVIVAMTKQNSKPAGPAYADPGKEPFSLLWPETAIDSFSWCEVGSEHSDATGERVRKELLAAQKRWSVDAAAKRDRLYVFQGVVSPSTGYITANPTGSVESTCAAHVTKWHYERLREDWALDPAANITIVDFYGNDAADADPNKGSYLEVVKAVNRRRAVLPLGSYAKTSHEIEVLLTVTVQGSTHELILPTDHGGDVRFVDSRLTATNHPLTAAEVNRLASVRKTLGVGEFVPLGSYLDVISSATAMLRARCRSSGRSYRSATLDLTRLPRTTLVSNVNGVLTPQT